MMGGNMGMVQSQNPFAAAVMNQQKPMQVIVGNLPGLNPAAFGQVCFKLFTSLVNWQLFLLDIHTLPISVWRPSASATLRLICIWTRIVLCTLTSTIDISSSSDCNLV